MIFSPKNRNSPQFLTIFLLVIILIVNSLKADVKSVYNELFQTFKVYRLNVLKLKQDRNEIVYKNEFHITYKTKVGQKIKIFLSTGGSVDVSWSRDFAIHDDRNSTS